jgi:hypothetical protein
VRDLLSRSFVRVGEEGKCEGREGGIEEERGGDYQGIQKGHMR